MLQFKKVSGFIFLFPINKMVPLGLKRLNFASQTSLLPLPKMHSPVYITLRKAFHFPELVFIFEEIEFASYICLIYIIAYKTIMYNSAIICNQAIIC